MRLTARLPALLAAIIAAPLLLPSGAFSAQRAKVVAQPLPSGLGSYADPFWGRQGDYICRRWCLSDRTPCDPVRYKAADGRCFAEYRSSYGELRCAIRNETRPECPTSPSAR